MVLIVINIHCTHYSFFTVDLIVEMFENLDSVTR